MTPSALDNLTLFGLKEDPLISEQMILNEQDRAERDALTAKILESTYWEKDRDAAFERFYTSLDFRKTLSLFDSWKISEQSSLVEIGGGSGFLSWGFAKQGFERVTLLEPNPHYITGTGYLRTRHDVSSMSMENSLERWYEFKAKYDTVVARNCVHHFQNITMSAACIRQKMNPDACWVMIREPHIDNCGDLYRFLQTHPFSQRYGIFEFAYPPDHFVNSIELAGFRLEAVVPARYANDALSLYSNDEGGRITRTLTWTVDFCMAHIPKTTAFADRLETAIRNLLPVIKLFSHPQVMLFRRIEIGNLPESAIWYPHESN